MSDVPTPQEYLGPSGIIRNSVWLTNEDIDHDKDTLVTIETVHIRKDVKFAEGRKRDVAVSLKFAGKKRELLVNATIKKVLDGLAGSTKCADWKGMQVLLYVVDGVRRGDGTTGKAVRVRAKRVGKQQAKAPQAEAPSSTDGDAEYREIMGTGGGA